MTDSGIVTVIRGNDSWLTLSIKHRHYKRTPSTHTCNNKTHRRSAGFSNHNLVQQTSRKLRSNQFKMEPALRMGTKQTEPWHNRIVASKAKPTALCPWRGQLKPSRRITMLRIANTPTKTDRVYNSNDGGSCLLIKHWRQARACIKSNS